MTLLIISWKIEHFGTFPNFKIYFVGDINTFVSLSIYSCLVLLSLNFEFALLITLLIFILFNYTTYRVFAFVHHEKLRRPLNEVNTFGNS